MQQQQHFAHLTTDGSLSAYFSKGLWKTALTGDGAEHVTL